jgi:carboxymethylenebutenolidase
MGEHIIPTARGALSLHLAEPKDSPPWPGVVVVHDALGMSADLRQQAEWLASAGYLAAAPDLYRGGSKLRCLFSFIRDGTRPLGDIRAVRGWLSTYPRCTGRVGILGFCMGGGFALMLAPDPDFSAASVNYGGLTRERRLVKSCPIVASYGGKDSTLRGVPQRLERVLSDAGVDHDVHVYPEAGHAFMNDTAAADVPRVFRLLSKLTSSGYHEPSAQDARRRILAFFGRHLRMPATTARA